MHNLALILGVYGFLQFGFTIGKIIGKRQLRVQCVNCGSHHTTHISSVDGGGGGLCKFAVRTSETHLCYDCGEFTSVNMKLNK